MPTAVPPEAAGEGHTLTVRPVLGDVSPEVGLSEMVGLFGPDGAGKTTLINTP
jgi:ABC-type multidrug transport system ATPase subunit